MKEREFKELNKIWGEWSNKDYEFNEAIVGYISQVRPIWLKLARNLSNLDEDDLKSLKHIRPHVDYLAEYKLLTLRHRRPKPGDVFVDLTDDESGCVWSPRKRSDFKLWRVSNRGKLKFYSVEIDLVSLLGQEIPDIFVFNPNPFIGKLKKTLGKEWVDELLGKKVSTQSEQ